MERNREIAFLEAQVYEYVEVLGVSVLHQLHTVCVEGGGSVSVLSRSAVAVVLTPVGFVWLHPGAEAAHS